MAKSHSAPHRSRPLNAPTVSRPTISHWSICDERELGFLCDASNAFSRHSYQSSFEAASTDPESFVALDLFSTCIEGFRTPLLRNGTNKYFDVSSSPRKFSATKFRPTLPCPNAYVIIPEAPHLLAATLGDTWNPRVALESVVHDLPSGPSWTIPYDCFDPASSRSLRLFDSHPSLHFYWLLCMGLLRDHGWAKSDTPVEVQFRPYKCDLASRFTSLETTSLFPSARHFKSESAMDAQRGRKRVFQNPSAANDATLLLVGDSHCYSAISQIMSFFFSEVVFFWASRGSNWGDNRDEITEIATNSADFFVEEASERFFLTNFTNAD